ncbi:hypothetical protein D3C76_1116080 [compost metagenome]
MQQHDITGQACRRRYALYVVGEDIVTVCLVVTGHVLRECHFVLELDDGKRSIDLRRRLDRLAPLIEATIARQMVP